MSDAGKEDAILELIVERDKLKETLKAREALTKTQGATIKNLLEEKVEAIRLLKNVLLSQDCEWENKNLGHDWGDTIAEIRDFIEKMNGRRKAKK